MKKKLLIAAFTVILLCSALNVALTMAAKCPECDGTGEIECPYCDGTGEVTAEQGEPCEHCHGTGSLEPNLKSTGSSYGLVDGKIFIQTGYRNYEPVSVHGKVTAKTEEIQGHTYTGTSSDTTFAPNEEDTQVTFYISGISAADYAYLQDLTARYETYKVDLTLEVNNIECPYCNGTGLAPATYECPRCGGTGYIECPECGGTGVIEGTENEGFDIGGALYGVAAVAVVAGVAVAAFVVVKQRRVKESDLRKLSPSEFQNWVLKRLGGKTSSQSDARMGIDGYTFDGQPVAIKQADAVGRNIIENFAASLGRSRAKNGTIVAFSFGPDAIRGKVSAKLNYKLEIQLLTVRELIESRNRPL
jgi:hypothetical protein